MKLHPDMVLSEVDRALQAAFDPARADLLLAHVVVAMARFDFTKIPETADLSRIPLRKGEILLVRGVAGPDRREIVNQLRSVPSSFHNPILVAGPDVSIESVEIKPTDVVIVRGGEAYEAHRSEHSGGLRRAFEEHGFKNLVIFDSGIQIEARPPQPQDALQSVEET